MKTIVFVALLAAAGCSKKTSDCDASIGKGMDSFAASVKASADPAMQETRTKVVSKLRGTLTQRCNEDKWAAEVVSCFATVVSMKDMQACQAKLSEEQRTKLVNDVRQVMMGSMGSTRMPPNVPGHPQMLGSAGGAGGSGSPEASGGATPGSPAGSAPAAPGSPANPAPPAAAGSSAPATGSNGW